MRAVSVPVLLLASWPLLASMGCKDKGDDSGDGSIGTLTGVDSDADGFTVGEGDCDDKDPGVYPGAEEQCDGLDNDCDGSVDEGVTNTYYQDSDGDGYGNPDKVEEACEEPDGFVTNSDDCDDANDARNPGEDEICDDVDNDCDGDVDEDAVDAATWYQDNDGDGYGRDDMSMSSCTQPDGYVEDGGDCDDGDAAYNPGADEDDCTDPNDYNCDGSVGYADEDGDGYAACEECDDGDASINPDATEVCDEIDNDCDDLVDDADDSLDTSTASTWYEDGDGDTFGGDRSTLACEAPDGWVADSTDCNDRVAEINPLATEICDGVDNDCDTLIDDDDPSVTGTSTWYEDADGDTYGGDTTVEACEEPIGYTDDSDDCDDTNADVNPDATEICDGIDNDCDTLIDDADDSVTGMTTWYEDADGDTYGNLDVTTEACEEPIGYTDDSDDCDDTARGVNPAATEICDGIDNDCDTLVDDADDSVTGTSTWYADSDGDTYGDMDVTADSCEAPDGYVADSTDCDDAATAVNPAATEICDGIDNDCDTLVDDADDSVTGMATWYEDGDSDTYGDPSVSTVSCEPPDGYVSDSTDCDDDVASTYPGALEYCNDVDDDCDDAIDEDAEDGADLADDADGDGYGDPGSTTWQCEGVDNEYDCNDYDDAEPQVVATDGSASGDGSMSSPWDSIQTAVEHSLECVLVESGTYYENFDFDGRDIVVFGMGTDETFIDASGTGAPAVTIAASETSAATLKDLSIIGGDGYYETDTESYACTSVTTCYNTYIVYSGGGIYINGTNPSIENVVVNGISLPAASTVTSGLTTTYTYSYGGGIAVINGAPSIAMSEVSENFADQGGGIYVDELSDATVAESWLIANSAADGAAVQADMGSLSMINVASMWNEASGDGGGLLVANGSATVTNTTWAGETGDALYASGTGSLTLMNSIVYDAIGYGILADGSASFSGSYNDIYGNSSGNYSGASAGTGSISADPLFTAWSDDGDPTNDDLTLQATSPAIDSGNPASAYNDADGTANDMGAFGGPGSDWAD